MARCLYLGDVDCLHGTCRVARGELPPIALVNHVLLSEARDGWLRFCSRKQKAAVFRAVRRLAREKACYDAWKVGWRIIVAAGIAAER